MTTVFGKLNLKDQTEILVLNALWLAYPKSTSKKYRCDFNRDTGWDALGQAGFEPVRQVAIDADWSALRFRRVAFIKTMQRREGMALSEQGKARTKAQKP